MWDVVGGEGKGCLKWDAGITFPPVTELGILIPLQCKAPSHTECMVWLCSLNRTI